MKGRTFMGYPSLTQCLLEAVDRYRSPHAQMYKTDGQWQSISADEMLRRVAGLARALAELGVEAGDRVGLFSSNRPEWHITDFAILGLGAVNVPVYFNESPERMIYILNHSGAKVVLTAGADQARRLLACRERLQAIEHVIVAGAPPEIDGDILRYEALIAGAGDAEVAAYRRRAAEVTSDRLATIIYTSGTTGEPKGVMLTHANISSNQADSFRTHNYSPRDTALSFLPLAHVYERLMGYGYLFHGVSMAYVESMEQVAAALLEIRPTVGAAVPRFFEKFYANMMETGHRATGFKRQVFDWALRVAGEAMPWRAYGRPVPLRVKLEWLLADWLAYSRIRAGMGGRVRAFISGGAPLARELAEFFWTVGVPIYQGYGLTETSPVVANNVPNANRVGTVGKPIPHVEVRIADDGEILVRGPCVMRGYYLKPAETREVLSDAGWLATGDVGYLDPDGYLVVTDRKKDLLKTAAGKFVAPQPIENTLKSSPFILNAAVVGDRRKFVAALIVPHFANVGAKARELGMEFSSRAELAAHHWVHELISPSTRPSNASPCSTRILPSTTAG
ncbi:MAG: long-chain fatty acid--CoA ligase [Acidobacteria bacterium]|nr:long-chain fatty acid--CoA ligase [Acidobacteriota bacterium]